MGDGGDTTSGVPRLVVKEGRNGAVFKMQGQYHDQLFFIIIT
jgi:hypothetical protein